MAEERYRKFAEGGKPHRWKKGVSGNPKGRPRKKSLEEVARELLDKEAPNAQGRTYLDLLAQALLTDAIKGDSTARRIVSERLWPAPRYIDIAARRDGDEPVEQFPEPDLDVLSTEDQRKLMDMAHAAIMGGAAPIDAEFREVVEDADAEQRALQDGRGAPEVGHAVSERVGTPTDGAPVEADAVEGSGGEDREDGGGEGEPPPAS